jgi:peptidoglycan/xylan/chitin deacetylase (PgdA/CDA1 family)
VDYARRHLVKDAAALCGCDLAVFLSVQKPYLSAGQVRALLDRGFSIGAHSMDHPLYNAITLDEQIRQTRGSMKFIAETFGIRCQSFAFPHTDTGVGVEFFAAMFGKDGLEVSFGTAGIRPHFFPRNIERFTMEKTDFPADRILARQYAKRWYASSIRREEAAL